MVAFLLSRSHIHVWISENAHLQHNEHESYADMRQTVMHNHCLQIHHPSSGGALT